VVELRNEWWLARRICGKNELCTLFLGVTDAELRRSRVRQAIIDRQLQNSSIGGKSQLTFAESFQRLYGQAL